MTLENSISVDDAMRLGQIALESGEPICFVGPPAIGKTDGIKALAADMDADLIMYHGAIADPTDIKGFAAIIDGTPKFLMFSDIKKLFEKSTKRMILFLDDFGQSPTLVQAGFMQILLERRINEYKITNPNVLFALATNRVEDRAGVSSFIEPLKSRAGFFNVRFMHDPWIQWCLRSGISDVTIGFNRFDASLMDGWKPDKEIKANPTPRGVAKFDKIYRTGRLASQPDVRDMATAYVGSDYGIKFAAYERMFQELPSKEDIWAKPLKARLPKAVDIQYAVATMLGRNMTAENMEASIAYMERSGREEFVVMMIKDAWSIHRDSLANVQAFAKFAHKYHKLIRPDAD